MTVEHTVEAKESIRITSIKISSANYEFVGRVGHNILDRVGREVGFRATKTSPNFSSMAQVEKWIKEQIWNI